MEQLIAVDLADVKDVSNGDHVMTLALGDRVDVDPAMETDDHIEVLYTTFEGDDGLRRPVQRRGRIRKRRGVAVTKPADELRILRVDFVDVQQGDGAIVQSPSGRVVLIDGGDNVLFARYLAGRFRDTSDSAPKEIDAIVVSHGDADHFAGLSQIRASERHRQPHKRLFIKPNAIFHNGLVKRPSRGRAEEELLGPTAPGSDPPLITGLVDDLRDLPDGELNAPFKTWVRAIRHWARRGPIEVRRIGRGERRAFGFLTDDGVQVEVLAPRLVTRRGARGLPFLGAPQRRFGHPSQTESTFGAPSASHTINGHSIVLRLTFGRWRLLFAGDLNEQAEAALADEHERGRLDLRSEVLKVPHHGSADFLHRFLGAVSPVVSIVSSGDESPRKEYIHPRATLMTGLGRHGRDHDPVLFVTELVAFFTSEGWVRPARAEHPEDEVRRGRRPFFGFSREAWGTVRVRTDGERLLVYTDSGLAKKKEAYVYTLADDGRALPQEPLRA